MNHSSSKRKKKKRKLSATKEGVVTFTEIAAKRTEIVKISFLQRAF